ncbi:response regulator transcription factor [Schlesneria sp.]|uniref:response regulator transcription factor n=1 Tax=Schlesneria sp. TaxID=2762018 RepID=UPI002F244FFD
MRVLVIEDEPNIRRLLREILEESGYCVDVAVDGHEGLSKAVTWPYDAVILDLLLPQMDGWELLESLRETHNTPVLILSARDALSDRVLGLDLGADDYLSKPFERVELLARLRALIRRSAGQSQSTISLEDLVVDLRGRRVLRDEVDLQLTAREFSVLEYLVLHRGRVVSRNEITDHLLDESDNSISNSLDVHISNLRKKLGRDVIATRRGQGYVVTQ